MAWPFTRAGTHVFELVSAPRGGVPHLGRSTVQIPQPGA